MENKISALLRIVTVDDSVIVAERLGSMLQEVGQVDYLGNVTSIASALDFIGEHHPDVTILDIHLKDDMLVANGVHLLIQLRRKYPTMKIIMLTNLSGAQYRSTCMTLGADYFFDKTNDFERIPETLKKIQQQLTAKD
jgi:two-component system response regulator DevR